MLLFSPVLFALAYRYVARASNGADVGMPWALFGGAILGLFLATVLSASIERLVIGRVALSAFVWFARRKLARAGRAPSGMKRVIELGKAWGRVAGAAAHLRAWLGHYPDVAAESEFRLDLAYTTFGLFRVETEPIYGERWRQFQHAEEAPPLENWSQEGIQFLRRGEFSAFIRASTNVLYHLRYWTAEADDGRSSGSPSHTRREFADALHDLGRRTGDAAAFRSAAGAFVSRFGGGTDFRGSPPNLYPRYLPDESDLLFTYRLITTRRGRSASARAYNANDIVALRTALEWDLLAHAVAEGRVDRAARLVLEASAQLDALVLPRPRGARHAV
jgi:hypothetical protein